MSEQPVSHVMSLVGELAARSSWSQERLEQHRRRALRDTIRHAVERSSYYRETLGPDAAADDVVLEELPTLSKATLLDEWDSIVTDPRLRLADVEARLEGSASDLHLGEYRVLATGGSTGMRGLFVNDSREFEQTMAGMLRTIVDLGVAPEARVASIGSPSPFHLSNHVFAALRSGRGGSPPLDVTMPLERIVEGLAAYRPDVVITYPSVLRLLAEEQLDGRLDIAPRMAGTSSEVLSDETRERVRQAWGIQVFDVYPSTEGGMMASECPAHCGRHVWEDMVVLEPVDEHNRPVSPGVPSHKVLLTNLWYRAQPLIRYELADSVTFAEGPNPTGRPFARIERIEGRSADILRLPALAGGEVAVHPFHLRAPFAGLSEVRQYQLARTDDRLTVRIVLRPDAARETPSRVSAALADALAAAGAAPTPVDVEPVAEIPRTGNGAKLTLVASR